MMTSTCSDRRSWTVTAAINRPMTHSQDTPT